MSFQDGTIIVYVDGAGGDNSAYGYYVLGTGESYYQKKPGLTNTEAEYEAILAALKKFEGSKSPVVIYSDSKVVVEQLNFNAGTKSPAVREMARKAWPIMKKYADLQILWMPREGNLAGKMLGN